MDERIKKYAQAVVNIGVNIQPGQNLVIYSDINAADFARVVFEEAYLRGAADVLLFWADEVCARHHYLLAPEENFGKVAEWRRARMQHLVDEKYHALYIASTDPENLKGVCTERIDRDQRAFSAMNKPRSSQTMANEVQWNVCSVPSVVWAKKVFPNAASDDEAVKLMWEAIFTACRIDDKSDPIENWRKHTQYLQEKANALNAHNFKSLKFTNSLGTDLEMELPENHQWVACGEKSQAGVEFVANMPTEEIFTAPKRDGVNGIVYSTKPFVYMGDLVEDFWIRFKDGKAVEYAAKKNQQLLEKLLAADEGSSFLGEVALVPHSSPISQSGILWYETLYDENASCHLALGKAYPTCVKDTSGKSEDELAALGLNQSLEHEDFMIGSADTDIVGITHDGQEIQIFKQGEWAL